MRRLTSRINAILGETEDREAGALAVLDVIAGPRWGVSRYLNPQHQARVAHAEARCLIHPEGRVRLTQLSATFSWLSNTVLGDARYECSVEQFISLKRFLSPVVPKLVQIASENTASPLEAVFLVDHLLVEGLAVRIHPPEFRSGFGPAPRDVVYRRSQHENTLRSLSARQRFSIGSRLLTDLRIS